MVSMTPSLGVFLSSSIVQHALIVGTSVAAVTALAGIFTILRGQTFAGHALADLGSVGGAGAFLVGVSQLWGFIGAGIIAAIVLELVGMERVRGRDVVTGIVFGTGLGLTALLLYVGTTQQGTSGAAVAVMFGSLFVLDSSIVPYIVVLSALTLAMLCILWRPLTVVAISPEMAAARGVRLRLTGLLFVCALALAVELSSMSIGAILSTALLIGPAACGLRLASRVEVAALLAMVLGVIAVCIGVWMSFTSYYWMPDHRSWPVSFCIVLIVCVEYGVARVINSVRAASRVKTARTA